MKLFISALVIAVSVYGCSSATTDGESGSKSSKKNGKYSAESGIVVYEAALPQNMGSNMRTLYFDDYGKQEKIVTVTSISAMGQSMNTETHSLIKDGYVYTWAPDESTGSKYKLEGRQDPSNLEYDNLTDEMKEKFNVKEEGTEELMDKKCNIYSMAYEGIAGKVWVWDNLPLKIQASAMGMIMTEKATDLQINVNIPKNNFELPEIEFSEISQETSAEAY